MPEMGMGWRQLTKAMAAPRVFFEGTQDLLQNTLGSTLGRRKSTLRYLRWSGHGGSWRVFDVDVVGGRQRMPG